MRHVCSALSTVCSFKHTYIIRKPVHIFRDVKLFFTPWSRYLIIIDRACMCKCQYLVVDDGGDDDGGGDYDNGDDDHGDGCDNNGVGEQ